MPFDTQHVARALVALLDGPQSEAGLAAGAFGRYDQSQARRLAGEVLSALVADGAVTGPDAAGLYTLERDRFAPQDLATLERFRKPTA
jgi:hypothetical protein